MLLSEYHPTLTTVKCTSLCAWINTKKSKCHNFFRNFLTKISQLSLQHISNILVAGLHSENVSFSSCFVIVWGQAAPLVWRRPVPSQSRTCTLWHPPRLCLSSISLQKNPKKNKTNNHTNGYRSVYFLWLRMRHRDKGSPSIFVWNSSRGRRTTSTNSAKGWDSIVWWQVRAIKRWFVKKEWLLTSITCKKKRKEKKWVIGRKRLPKWF